MPACGGIWARLLVVAGLVVPVAHAFHICGACRAEVGGRALRCSAAGEGTSSQPFVALTREKGKNGKFQKMLEKRGIVGRELPCIAFESLGAPLPAALQEEWEYVVVTSPEAASVFSEGWAAAGKPAIRVACVGTGTQQALLAVGVDPVFVPSKATGKVLAAELPGPDRNGRVLYPASLKAATHVQDGLGARGFQVVRLNTYDTVSAAWTDSQMELGRTAAAVALASPSAAKIWAERMGTGHPAACIGETSAEACDKAGFRHVYFPESPGLDGWADSVEQALAAAGLGK